MANSSRTPNRLPALSHLQVQRHRHYSAPGVECPGRRSFPAGGEQPRHHLGGLEPDAPDKNMGLWRDVYVTTTGPVALRHPQVITKVDLPSLDKAHLIVSAELENPGDKPLKATIKGRSRISMLNKPSNWRPTRRSAWNSARPVRAIEPQPAAPLVARSRRAAKPVRSEFGGRGGRQDLRSGL